MGHHHICLTGLAVAQQTTVLHHHKCLAVVTSGESAHELFFLVSPQAWTFMDPSSPPRGAY